MRARKVALRYFKKVSGLIHLSKQYILKIKECFKKYQNDKIIKYETDESRAPLLLKSIWTDTFIEALHLKN
jgi:hypothetical protein